jgi:hypothetical protein
MIFSVTYKKKWYQEFITNFTFFVLFCSCFCLFEVAILKMSMFV